MNRSQKAAWFIVINFTIAIIISITMYAILLPKTGFSKASSAISFMGLCGLSGFVPIFFKKDPGNIQSDERDIMITRKSAIAGFASAYLFVGLACMLPFTIMGNNATVSVRWLPMIFTGAGILNFYIHSITLLILYGRGGKR